MNLYEIDNEILKTFDEETGEILDADRLNELEMDRTQKLTNIIHWIKNLRSDAKILKEEEDSFKKRRMSCPWTIPIPSSARLLTEPTPRSFMRKWA